MLTLINLPLNSDSLRTMALPTKEASANSTYANLAIDDGEQVAQSVNNSIAALYLSGNSPLWMPRELVAENGDAIDVAATLEMLLNLFWRRSVVHL